MSKIQRYEKLKEGAKWLDAKSFEVVRIEIESVSKDKPNVIVVVDIRSIATFRDKEIRAFSAMFSLADTIFMCATKDFVRYTFGIEHVWD